jgi:hypothetical protein
VPRKGLLPHEDYMPNVTKREKEEKSVCLTTESSSRFYFHQEILIHKKMDTSEIF